MIKTTFTILSILIFLNIEAQENFVTTGADVTGSNATVSYSIGQIVYTTNSDANGNTISQGVQQPFEISVVNTIKEAEKIKINISVYPNPTTSFLLLDVKNYKSKHLSYKLINENGSLIKSDKIYMSKSKIEMQELNTSIYFVEILENQKIIKTFKIIKK